MQLGPPPRLAGTPPQEGNSALVKIHSVRYTSFQTIFLTNNFFFYGYVMY
jgi:hypothetical protein